MGATEPWTCNAVAPGVDCVVNMSGVRRALAGIMLVLASCGDKLPSIPLGEPPRWITVAPDGCLEYESYSGSNGALQFTRDCPGDAQFPVLVRDFGTPVATPQGSSKFIRVVTVEVPTGFKVTDVRGTFGGQLSVLGSFLILVAPDRFDFTIEGIYQGRKVQCPPARMVGVIGVLAYRCTF